MKKILFTVLMFCLSSSAFASLEAIALDGKKAMHAVQEEQAKVSPTGKYDCDQKGEQNLKDYVDAGCLDKTGQLPPTDEYDCNQDGEQNLKDYVDAGCLNKVETAGPHDNFGNSTTLGATKISTAPNCQKKELIVKSSSGLQDSVITYTECSSNTAQI